MNTTKKALSVQIALLCVAPQLASAASFQILEQSPAQLGKAFAGSASDIEDATTVFFNPAGMTQLEQNTISGGLNLIKAEAEFSDAGSNTGGQTAATNESAVIPNLYSVSRLNDQWSFGLGLNAPYGMSSSYDNEWYGRYLATESALEVVNINANAAFEVNSNWSLGFGINYQRMEVTLESAFDSSLGLAPDPATDSYAAIEGDDSDFVVDLSVFWKPTDAAAVGLVWRQGGAFDLSGTASFTLDESCAPGVGPDIPTQNGLVPLGSLCAAALNDRTGDIGASVELPDTLTLSGSYTLNSEWALHADFALTQWSSIDEVVVARTGTDTVVSVLDLQYDDTQRVSIGASYNPEGAWKWRVGVAFDEAPQTDPTIVTPRIPDGDRTWISGGFNYRWSDALSLDAAYTHILIDDAEIDSTTPTPLGQGESYLLAGAFDSAVNIFAIQLNWSY